MAFKQNNQKHYREFLFLKWRFSTYCLLGNIIYGTMNRSRVTYKLLRNCSNFSLNVQKHFYISDNILHKALYPYTRKKWNMEYTS